MIPDPCALCTGPGKIFCKSCAEYDENDVLIKGHWYCSPLCRTADESNHKNNCSPKRAPGEDDILQRAMQAGHMVQALFYTFIHHSWAYDMANVRIMRNQYSELIAIEITAGRGVEAGPGRESTCERHAGGWLIRFPYAAFVDEEHEAMQAILADQNSVWAFVCMHAIVKTLFEDLVHDTEEDIKEVVHYLPDHVRRLVHHKDRFGLGSAERDDLPYPDRDGRGNIKGVYRVKLRDNTMIAIDLAGAQYSVLYTTIMPWLAYCNKWVSTIKFQIPFRSHYEKHMENMSNYRCITHLTIIMEQMIYLHVFVTFAERELGFHLKDLSSMCYDDFKDARAQVLQQAIHYLRRRSQELDSDRSAMSMLKTFDLRHPAVAKAVKAKSMLFDFGDMKNVDWDMLRELIRMPNSVVKYKEKVKLRTLLTHRCVYKVPGNRGLVFLKDTLPSRKVPDACVSENPYWMRR